MYNIQKRQKIIKELTLEKGRFWKDFENLIEKVLFELKPLLINGIVFPKFLLFQEIIKPNLLEMEVSYSQQINKRT